MKKCLIIGINGSIGKKMKNVFSSEKWEVFSLDTRTQKWNDDKFDCIIFANGGDGDSFDSVFQKNVKDLLKNIQFAIGSLNKNGSLFIFNSRRSIRPLLDDIIYSAAKSASHSIVQAYYRSMPNLRITSVCPAWVESNMAIKGNAKRVIPVEELCRLILGIAELEHVRIPELKIEAIGDNEF